MTTVSLSEAGLQLIVLDHEFQQNVRTIRRLERDLQDTQARLNELRARQSRIMMVKRAIDMTSALNPITYPRPR